MGDYDYLAKIYDFAKENAYKVKNLNVGYRRNQRGRYTFVSLELIIPEEPTLTDNKKDEVNKDEI